MTDATLTPASAATSLNDMPFPSRSASISATFHGDRFDRLDISEDRVEPSLPFCQTVFCSLLRNGREGQLGFKKAQQMPRSRTKAPLLHAFGGVLKQLHGEHEQQANKKLSHDALSRTLTARIAKRVSPSVTVGATTLWRWEAGEVASPDPLILRELGDLYGVGFHALLAVLEANLKNPRLTSEDGARLLFDLLRQTGDQTSDPQTGRSDVAHTSAAHARLQQLEAQHATALQAMQDVADQLVDALAAQGVDVLTKDARAGKKKSGARGGTRKAG